MRGKASREELDCYQDNCVVAPRLAWVRSLISPGWRQLPVVVPFRSLPEIRAKHNQSVQPNTSSVAFRRRRDDGQQMAEDMAGEANARSACGNPGYLTRMVRRMEQTRFRPEDPLYRDAVKAQSDLMLLVSRPHYLTCKSGTQG